MMPGTHLCLKRWWKADPRCRRLWGNGLQGATEGQVSSPDQVQYGSYYIKETIMLKDTCSLSATCFVFLSFAFTCKMSLFFIRSTSFFLSFNLWCRGCLWCPISEVFDLTCTPSSPHLHWIFLLLSLCPRPALSYTWSSIFPLQAVWCSCLPLSACLPLFWHPHAVKDREKRHGHRQLVPRHKSALMACHADFKTFGGPCTSKPSDCKKQQ